jgi:peptidoglycan/LPS O-acetylase OafA/YrhL
MFSNHLIGTYGYQLWFISTIIQFYLFFPLVVRMRIRFPGISFLAVGLIISWAWAVVVLLFRKEELRNWNSFFLIYLWEFMLGMYCADRYLKNGYAFWNITRSRLIIIAIAGLGIYSIMAIWFGRAGKIFNDLPGLFGYASLCVLVYSLQIRIVNRFILFTSKISFSIFLIHFLVLNLMQAALSAVHISWFWPMLLPTIIICYALAIPLQKFFDQLTASPSKQQQDQHSALPKN